MVFNKKDIIIVSTIIAVFLTYNLYNSYVNYKENPYKRLSSKNKFVTAGDEKDLHEFTISYMKHVFPDLQIVEEEDGAIDVDLIEGEVKILNSEDIYLNRLEYSKFDENNNEWMSTNEMWTYFYGTVDSIDFPLRIIFSNVWEGDNPLFRQSYDFKNAIAQKTHYKYGSNVLRKIYFYNDTNGNKCYFSAINNEFSLITTHSYCPHKRRFATKEEQMANYIYDTFMALDIPSEYNRDYLKE